MSAKDLLEFIQFYVDKEETVWDFMELSKACVLNYLETFQF